MSDHDQLDPLTPRPPEPLPNEVEFPTPEEVNVPEIVSISSEKVFGIIPAIRKIALQIKWGAVIVFVLPVINLLFDLVGLPHLSSDDVASWEGFGQWLAYAAPVIVTIIIGWFSRPAPQDGVKTK